MKYKILPCKCHRVGSDGSYWSKYRQFSVIGLQGIQTRKTRNWNLLKATRTRYGYIQVNNHGKVTFLHRIIASNFIQNPLGYINVLHKDDFKTNNTIANLYWGNAQMNAIDRIKNGKNIYGEKQRSSKLKEVDIPKIRTDTRSLNQIAKSYNVSKKLILLVKQNKIWKHVK